MLESVLKQAATRRRLPTPPMRRALREQAGLTQAELAEALGVRRSTISRWETGDRTPRGQDAVGYVALLDEIAAHLDGDSR